MKSIFEFLRWRERLLQTDRRTSLDRVNICWWSKIYVFYGASEASSPMYSKYLEKMIFWPLTSSAVGLQYYIILHLLRYADLKNSSTRIATFFWATSSRRRKLHDTFLFLIFLTLKLCFITKLIVESTVCSRESVKAKCIAFYHAYRPYTTPEYRWKSENLRQENIVTIFCD